MQNPQLTQKFMSYIANNDLKSLKILWSKRAIQNAVDLNALFSASIEVKDVWVARNFFNSMKDQLHRIQKPTVIKMLQYGREDLLHILQNQGAGPNILNVNDVLNAAMQINNSQLFFNYVNKTLSSTAVHSTKPAKMCFNTPYKDLQTQLIDQNDLQLYVEHFLSTKNHSFLMTVAVLIAEQNNLEKMQQFVEWGGLIKGPEQTFAHIYHHAFTDASFYIDNGNKKNDLLENILPLMTWLANLSQKNETWEKLMREHINKNFYFYCIKATGHTEHVQNILPTVRTKHDGKHADVAAEMSQYLLTQSIEQHLTSVAEPRKRKM